MARPKRQLKLKVRHIKTAESTAYRLPIPPVADYADEMKRLRALAERWDVVRESLKRPGDWSERASMALRFIIFLGDDFYSRSEVQQIRTYRHELSHILAQRILGFLWFAFLYKFQRYRWALEVSAESEVVVTMVEQGVNQKAMDNHIQRYAHTICVPDGLYKFSRLNHHQARHETVRVLKKAAKDGRPRIK